MFCTHCGIQVAPHASYCPSCGGAQPGNVANRHLVRPIIGRKVGGVCAGIANYLNTEITLVRVIAVLAMLVPPFPAVLVYLICWIVIPSQEYAPMAAPQTPPPAPAQPQSQQ
jgi:phage shock protein C